MAICAASLLGTEYPGDDPELWSYPMLAQALQKIGVPTENLTELFDRMMFNGTFRNDDDHPRNHAAIYNVHEKRWSLSPTFDVVPNNQDDPHSPILMTMQVSKGRRDVRPASVLGDTAHFGFQSRVQARDHLHALLTKIEASFLDDIARQIFKALAAALRKQAATAIGLLRTNDLSD